MAKSEQSPAEAVIALRKRVDAANNAYTAAQTAMEMHEKTLQGLLAQLSEFGCQTLEELDVLLETETNKLEESLKAADTILSEIKLDT